MGKKSYIPFFLTTILWVFFMTRYGMAQSLLLYDKGQDQQPALGECLYETQPSSPASRQPPPGPVQCVAEWEESEGILMKWKNYDLIQKMQPHNLLYIPVNNQAEKDQWISDLNDHGIPLTNIEFLFIKTDSRWTRDYGPWFIWDANNEMGIVNYTCHFGYWDDLFPLNFSSLYGIKYYESGLYHVGGNWYPNGYGRAFSSSMVYQENAPALMDETDEKILDYLGIDHYYTVNTHPLTLEHLDCWIKPANPETLLVVQFPEDSEYYPFGEEISDYYETLMSPWGRPYKIIRLPMFKMGSGMWYEFRPYMNSLVSNKKVYMPICYHPDDEIAKGIFQEAFPGYEIVGANHYGTGWGGLSIHCSTRNFHKREVIRIYPYPPGDTEDTLSGYTVRAEVIPPNGSVLLPGYPVIHWTDTGSAPFGDIIMTSTGQPHEYIGHIPGQPLGTMVSFYIEARDNGELSAIYPLVAPDGMMSFEVRQDTGVPALSRSQSGRSTAASQWPLSIRTLCKDDMAEPEVKVEYEINGIPQLDVALTREPMCYWYSGVLGGSVVPGDVVTYRILASDHAVAPNTSNWPKLGKVCCPVKDSGTVAIVDMSRRSRTGPFIRETLDKLGIPCVRYTTWPTDWSEHKVWFICLGVYAYNHVLSSSEAWDIIAALQAGNHIYLEAGDTWCYDPEKDTLNPWFRVDPKGDGGELVGLVKGEPGTLMDGIGLDYAGEHDFVDAIEPLTPAEMLFRSDDGSKGRTVLYNGGTYKTVASSFALGGCFDGTSPDTKKEILLRYLSFFGLKDIRLKVLAAAHQGETVPVRLEGDPGENYLLLASLADFYLDMPGYGGVFRLDPSFLFTLALGVIPSYGFVEFFLPIPRNEDLLGYEIHFQAVIGEKLVPGLAKLTNREIMTLVE